MCKSTSLALNARKFEFRLLMCHFRYYLCLQVNRIHRFGQLAETVRVRKFIVSDSVEERIVELQKKKAYVADEIYSDKGGGGSGEIGSTRLGMDDLRQIFHAHTHQPGNPPTTNDTESRET